MKKGLVIWLIYMLILAGAAGFVLYRLHGMLKDYQVQTDKETMEEEQKLLASRAPEQAVESYAAGIDADWWTEKLIGQETKEDIPHLDTQSMIHDYFSALLDRDGAALYRAKDWSEDSPVYTEWIGDGRDASARLYLTGKGTDWSVSDVEISVPKKCSGETEALSGCSVYCNETLLDDTFSTQEDSGRFPFPEQSDELENPVQWRTWRVSDLLCEPDLRVEKPDGMETEYSDVYGCDVYCMSGNEASRIEDRAEAFLRAYLDLVTNGKEGTDERMAACLSLVKNGSEAYDVLNASRGSIEVSMDYSDLRIEILAKDAPVIWADNACTADICYHAYARYQGKEQDYSVDDETFRVLFLNRGSGYEICAFNTLE